MKEHIFDTLSKLIEVNFQLFKLEIQQELSNVIVRLTISIICIIFANMAVVLSSFAIAFLLGEWLHNNAYGFAIVALFYMILTAIAWLNRETIGDTIRIQVQAAMLAKRKIAEQISEQTKAIETNRES
jgi:hypothetical protein